MFIAVDFDKTIVADGLYDATTPLQMIGGAREALTALKAAGHKLLLWSSRSSRALLFNPQLDPFVRTGVRRFNPELWCKEREVHLARHRQMLEFVARELPGIFDAVDGGGKPVVDLILDDEAALGGGEFTPDRWRAVAARYGARSW
jgi:hypothetical protein